MVAVIWLRLLPAGNSLQAAAASAQDAAKAKADAIIADIKATPNNLQREAVKAGEAAVDEVGFDDGATRVVTHKQRRRSSNVARTDSVDFLKLWLVIASGQVGELCTILEFQFLVLN